MTYSCAYWSDADGDPREPSDLTAAQFAKCDLVARKLGLAPGMRVLDIGCGWGTFALHAAREYGAQVVGVTISSAQAEYARKRMADEGVADQVEIRVQDYREVADGPFDAISSIGMAEHVGSAKLPGYAADLFALLRPAGPAAEPGDLAAARGPAAGSGIVVVHRPLRVPRRRAGADGDDGGRARGRRLRGA